jgi:hypothetical protein
MLISPVLVSKFLSDPDEPDYYKAARIVANLMKHDLAEKNPWKKLQGEYGTVVDGHCQCLYPTCQRHLFVCKVNLPIDPTFLNKLGIIEEKTTHAYYLIQQHEGREQTLCTLGYGRTDRRYAKYRQYHAYVSIPRLLAGKQIIQTDDKYLCGRFNILR